MHPDRVSPILSRPGVPHARLRGWRCGSREAAAAIGLSCLCCLSLSWSLIVQASLLSFLLADLCSTFGRRACRLQHSTAALQQQGPPPGAPIASHPTPRFPTLAVESGAPVQNAQLEPCPAQLGHPRVAHPRVPGCLPRPAQAFFGLVSCDGERSAAYNLTFLLGALWSRHCFPFSSRSRVSSALLLGAPSPRAATTSPVSPFYVASSILFLSSEYQGSVLSDAAAAAAAAAVAVAARSPRSTSPFSPIATRYTFFSILRVDHLLRTVPFYESPTSASGLPVLFVLGGEPALQRLGQCIWLCLKAKVCVQLRVHHHSSWCNPHGHSPPWMIH